MDRRLRQLVLERARFCCEYCQMPQAFSDAGHEMDHIIAEKHGGLTTSENLALACFHCNNHKGPNIAGVDPESGAVTRLFHPRLDRWNEHFYWSGAVLCGQTSIGRTTVRVLDVNIRHRLLHRQALVEEGVFPPFNRP
ncbi:MAG: HNH endonuclease [Planctomycetaceae bacterium]